MDRRSLQVIDIDTVSRLQAGLRDPSLPFGVDLLIPQVGGSARKTNVSQHCSIPSLGAGTDPVAGESSLLHYSLPPSLPHSSLADLYLPPLYSWIIPKVH